MEIGRERGEREERVWESVERENVRVERISK